NFEMLRLCYETMQAIWEEHPLKPIYSTDLAKWGAVYPGRVEGRVIAESAGRYGRALGLAFQIQDDLLDIAGEQKMLGKTYGSDVVEGKKTYLYILARRLFSKDDLETYNSIIREPHTSMENILRIKDLYEKYHIISKAENEAKRYIDEAISIINSIPETMDNSELKDFTEWMLNRKY
ncbi:MAG: polyprenyl synthetase family protein, partial [Candidatus Delongbacteria bacterium]